MNDAKFMVNAMLRVDEEAARIKAKASGRNPYNHEDLTLEEKQEIAFQCIESNRINEKEKLKLSQARSAQKKILREYDPRIGIEERHQKVAEKKISRIAKATAEENLEQLRFQRQKLIEEISPQELEKIKNEIKQNLQETKAQDMNKRKQVRELLEREKIAKQKEELLIEREKKTKEFLEHKISRFSVLLSNFIRNYKKCSLSQSFQRVNIYAIYLKSTMLKINRKYRFRRIRKAFINWKTISIRMRLEEEAIIFQQEQEKNTYLNEIAKKNYEFWLKRKSFESLEKNLTLLKLEREQQIEALKRREKLQNFMNFIKQRSEEEYNNKKAQEILERHTIEKEKELEQRRQLDLFYKNYNNEIISAKTLTVGGTDYDHPSDREVKISSLIDAETEIDQHLIKKSEKLKKEFDGDDNLGTQIIEPKANDKPEVILHDEIELNKESKSKTPKNPKEVARMQERQSERKQKREALENKYKERKEREEKLAQEAIQKAQAEEKQKKKELLNKRKQEERLKREREEKRIKYLEELEKSTDIACNHYERKLYVKLFTTWKKVHAQLSNKETIALNFYERKCKRDLLYFLFEACRRSQKEKADLEIKRMNWAYSQYLKHIEYKYFTQLKKFYCNKQKEAEDIVAHRFDYLKRSTLRAWHMLIPELMDDRYELEKREETKINQFRKQFYCPQILREWRAFSQNSKEKKLKQVYTQAMWEKAQQWLSETEKIQNN